MIGVHATAITDREGRATAHRARLAPYVEPHLARRQAGEKHPVHDFLFTYYSFSPAKLLDWRRTVNVTLGLPFARTSRRNISPEPVATSSTFMPSRSPEASSAQRCAREWNSMVDTGYTADMRS